MGTIPRKPRSVYERGKSKELDASAPLLKFAIGQVGTRLDKLARQAELAAKSQNADTVHDLRVAIRRFSQGLILFPEFFPSHEVKKIRKRLKSTMNLSSEVRNRDIALEHLDQSGDDLVKARLHAERASHATILSKAMDRWAERDYPVRWRASLELEPR